MSGAWLESGDNKLDFLVMVQERVHGAASCQWWVNNLWVNAWTHSVVYHWTEAVLPKNLSASFIWLWGRGEEWKKKSCVISDPGQRHRGGQDCLGEHWSRVMVHAGVGRWVFPSKSSRKRASQFYPLDKYTYSLCSAHGSLLYLSISTKMLICSADYFLPAVCFWFWWLRHIQDFQMSNIIQLCACY